MLPKSTEALIGYVREGLPLFLVEGSLQDLEFLIEVLDSLSLLTDLYG